jgi:hypothetical protein
MELGPKWLGEDALHHFGICPEIDEQTPFDNAFDDWNAHWGEPPIPSAWQSSLASAGVICRASWCRCSMVGGGWWNVGPRACLLHGTINLSQVPDARFLPRNRVGTDEPYRRKSNKSGGKRARDEDFGFSRHRLRPTWTLSNAPPPAPKWN